MFNKCLLYFHYFFKKKVYTNLCIVLKNFKIVFQKNIQWVKIPKNKI